MIKNKKNHEIFLYRVRGQGKHIFGDLTLATYPNLNRQALIADLSKDLQYKNKSFDEIPVALLSVHEMTKEDYEYFIRTK